MEFLRRAVPVILAGLLALSCSENTSDPAEEKEQRSFERWMQMNVPQALKFDNGMYYQWISTSHGEGQQPRWGDYVEINYRGLLLCDYNPETEKASIFMTRYQEDAKRLGTFTHYTHYVPQMIIYNRSNYLMEGMQAALEFMSVGDSVRLFLPSSLTQNTSMLTTAYGYGGNVSMPSVPLIVEMSLAGIVEQPQTKEEKFVNEFAAREWGQSLKDTIREYIYLNKHDLVLEPGFEADTVKSDSTAFIYYAAFFGYDYKRDTPEEMAYDYLEDPDNKLFLIETNIESVAKKYSRNVSLSSQVTFKPSSPPSTPTGAGLAALSEVFNTETIWYGSTFEVMTTSSYAYEVNGQEPASDVTEVQAFQPIYLYVEVEPYVDPEEDDD